MITKTTVFFVCENCGTESTSLNEMIRHEPLCKQQRQPIAQNYSPLMQPVGDPVIYDVGMQDMAYCKFCNKVHDVRVFCPDHPSVKNEYVYFDKPSLWQRIKNWFKKGKK